jgi:formylglycine-generating enzyme required for sulfatase activity
MKGVRAYIVVSYTAVCLAAAVPAGAGTHKCPPDSVKVGNICIDTYEASVWSISPSNTSLVKKVQEGKATLADLTKGGATQLKPSPSCTPGFPANFPTGGQWTPVPGSNPPSPGVYAVSVAGVAPTACIDWFQAAQACRLSGKRLATNLEWQDAAAGTPEPGNTPGPNDCNTNSLLTGPSNTGSRANCKSSWGVFDMVGNVDEWVADWADLASTSNSCTDWTTSAAIPGSDFSCFGGPGGGGGNSVPAALLRGGDFGAGVYAGVFFVSAGYHPSFGVEAAGVGFRCAR